ncbi:hypothetical protein KC331_g4215 [Hortaea werneckii]|uniref:Alanyl-transfer RNA synthetases family profile domain-containing protein n=1 Tax=Hortaea werneckii TaxID=91943 RepID=A0A3M7BT76_HORWE|nr:hypothetical protein KC331_g4215 [Hortaea werneckii]KAI7713374.1 hypothetical protein KC353_g7607 [Hortaea werneckii]RMY42981.1 hypothetical protein D0865_11573 [Hortaea werneckii]
MTDTSFPSSRPTKAIYQYEEGLRNHIARVVAIQPFSALSDAERGLFKTGSENTYAVETNETIFYAQGGGQPFDTGYIETANHEDKRFKFIVEAVRNASEGRILHFGHFEDPTTIINLTVGDIIEQHIDSARRDLNSRIHTAGHLIALSIRHLAQQEPDLTVTELKAQHYPETSFVEFQGSIDGKFKEAIQSQSTQYVKDALSVKLAWYLPNELASHAVITAEGMPIVAGADGKVRVVDIVGAGAYPCGGTHVPDTSRVGEIVVKGIKRQKGNSKVSYAVLDAKGGL